LIKGDDDDDDDGMDGWVDYFLCLSPHKTPPRSFNRTSSPSKQAMFPHFSNL